MKPVCIAIVDSAHARLYSYQGDPPVFREVQDLVHPGRRTQERDASHRDHHRAEWDHQFAKQIVDACLELARGRGFGHVIFVTSPRMLGQLRTVSEPFANAGMVIDELERDFAGLSSPQIHDRLADAHFVDPRARAR